MEKRYGWVIVAAGALITCMAMGAIFALPVYLQPIAEETEWSRGGISGAMTLAFIVMGVGGFGWGVLSDRIGARPVVLIAGVLLGGGLILASFATSLLMFQLAYGGIAGASVGAFFAPLIATTVGWFDKHRSLAVSLVSIGGGVAPMIMTPLASVLIENYRLAHRDAVDRHRRHRRDPAGRPADPPPAGRCRFADAIRRASAPPRRRHGPRLRSPPFIVLAVTFFLCCAAHSGPIFHTVSYAMICGASSLAAASIYSVEGLAGLAGRLVFGLLADRVGVRKIIVGGLALQAIGIYSYIYVSDLSDFYVRAVVLGMAYGGVMPLYSILARDYFSQNVMGTVLGATTLTSSLGMALGPMGGGWLFDTFGTYHWLYVASAAVGAAAALVALAFPAPRAPRQQGELQPA